VLAVDAAPRTDAPPPPSPAPSPSTDGAQVVRAGPGDAEALAEFYRQTWDAGATAESVRVSRRRAAAANTVSPGEEVPTFLFTAGGRVLGHVTTLPLRIWDGHATLPAYWLTGLMVLPEARNGPVGFLLLREAVRHLPRTMGMVVAPEARRLFTALGFLDLGTLCDRVRLLEPKRVIRALAADGAELPAAARKVPRALLRSPLATALMGAAARAALGAWCAVADSPRYQRGWILPELPLGEVHRLWMRTRSALRGAPARDAGDLEARYGQGGYRWIGVRESGGLVALGVLRPPSPGGDARLGGIALATLADVVVPPDRPDAARALLATAELAARGLGADALLCAASHSSLAGPMRRRGYLQAGARVHAMVRAPGDDLPRSASAWWLTRGDGHADEVF
jgi:GNAT superfamily N-acetyltransferase